MGKERCTLVQYSVSLGVLLVYIYITYIHYVCIILHEPYNNNITG